MTKARPKISTPTALSVPAEDIPAGCAQPGTFAAGRTNLRGQATPPGGNDESQASLEGVGDFTAVSAGDSHTCGQRRDGTVVCWGLNDHSQADPR